ncbi:hypothetical protein DT73_01085 [Mangrovibacter sp. MFB070]|uniref:hypothetical protein n=1 Tax=Mangrovibacter sp. MFB070 TaxID=1224318 RepID=UPI0004DA22C4|nr:hypothetical protein [Mangrovibacter sp. MFB070]KEA54498.1 hypothetical protein DT73_01085 [Mangrovibacter sp. MFB070]
MVKQQLEVIFKIYAKSEQHHGYKHTGSLTPSLLCGNSKSYLWSKKTVMAKPPHLFYEAVRFFW